MLASNVENPTQLHMSAANRVLWYLNGTADKMMMVCSGQYDQLPAFVDASWGANNEKNRRSWSGIVIVVEESIIYAASNVQKNISLSSTEAEYVAVSNITETISWLRQLLIQLRVQQESTRIYEDNSSSIECATGGNTKHFSQRKLFDVRHNHVMNENNSNNINIVYVSTEKWVPTLWRNQLDRKVPTQQ